MSDGVKRVLGDIYDGMRLRYVVEEEPLGTAGPGAAGLDEGVLEERLLVLNGDVLTDIDLTAELAAARAHRRARDARALPGRGHRQLRRGADRRRRARRGLPREGRGRDAHQPHQRRRLRGRARGGRVDPRRPRRLVRARGVPGAGRQRASTATRPRATGSTSGRPSATSRRPGTCSPGASSSKLPPRDETGSLDLRGLPAVGRAHRPAERARPPLLGRQRLARRALGAARPRDGRRRRRGASRACWPRACGWASARASSRARSSAPAR